MKAQGYRLIDSLTEYLLIAQYRAVLSSTLGKPITSGWWWIFTLSKRQSTSSPRAALSCYKMSMKKKRKNILTAQGLMGGVKNEVRSSRSWPARGESAHGTR